ncbi:t-SNARE [Gamsiella multidivaricata]|uniref:t-SNARE n=1 Tax=Gamsiella multidivaricata TaxID=101098 RepID=UPI002220C072|nr:t-SNARE [Gamsiella multidivaricata]KAI7818031.1 t-SNARE [Gamsiella multidivaricata]
MDRSSLSSNAGGHGNAKRWNQGGPDLGDVSVHAFQAKINHISQQVFRISSNVSSIQRLVGYLGTTKDSQDVRTKLQDVTEQTRNLVRDTSQDIKDLTKFDAAGKKLETQKVSKDFSKILVEFQKIQRVSAEKQRDFVFKARQVGSRNSYSETEEEVNQGGEQPLLNNDQRRMQLLVVDNELEYNESMITQREGEILEIEQGITELNEIFRDLGTMVHEQGNMLAVLIKIRPQTSLDSIESNVTSVSMTTQTAAEELTVAAKHQKEAQSKSCYLLLIAAIVAGIIILAIS